MVGRSTKPEILLKQSCWAVIPAAGIGKRLQIGRNDTIPKQYLKIQGRTILEHTLGKLNQLNFLSGIVLVIEKQDSCWSQLDIALKEQIITAEGGKQRANSVLNGLQVLQGVAKDTDWVLVHDVVRPCVLPEDICTLMSTLADSETGGLLAIPVNETLKKVNGDLTVDVTVPREKFWLAGTPQIFRLGMLRNALGKALADNLLVTDEAHAMEHAGHPVKVVQGSADNIKITHAEDLFLAEQILNKQVMQ